MQPRWMAIGYSHWPGVAMGLMLLLAEALTRAVHTAATQSTDTVVSVAVDRIEPSVGWTSKACRAHWCCCANWRESRGFQTAMTVIQMCRIAPHRQQPG